jgi:hypothetical protein
MSRRRLGQLAAAVGVAVLAVAGALSLPSPKAAAPTTTSTDGTIRLHDVWPHADVLTIPAAIDDGSTYQPMLVLDPNTSVGLTTSADLETTKLVMRTGNGPFRELRVLSGESHPLVAAVTISGDQLYWLEITASGEDEGARQTTVWRANVHTGSAQTIASDSSDVLYFDSGYDLQVAGGQLRWAANGSAEDRGELRSVPITGGPVTGRELDRLYALSAWPWATSSAANLAGNVDLLNLETGEHKTITAKPNEILTCTPVWCRVTTLVDQGQKLTFEVEHIDGRDRRAVGDGTLTPLNTDVALMDRFELVASLASTNAQRLWLEDLKTNRSILLDDAVSATVGSRGGYLWWSTGDGETLTWHVLDLRTLT